MRLGFVPKLLSSTLFEMDALECNGVRLLQKLFLLLNHKLG